MKNILKKGLVLVLVYSIFVAYLLFAMKRVEQLEYHEETERVNVVIHYSE